MEFKERKIATKKVLAYLEKRDDIYLRMIEDGIGAPRGSLRVSEGVLPKKWIDSMINYLVKTHGYNPKSDIDIPQDLKPVKDSGYTGKLDLLAFHSSQKIKSPGETIDGVFIPGDKKRWYGQGRIPGFTDGVLRFRDPETGLWRRYDEHAYSRGLLKKGWELDGEVFEDKVGEYQKIGYRDLLIYSSFKGDESYLKGEMAKIYK